MKVDITLFISKRKKLSLLALLLLLFISVNSYSQSCDCPTLDSCGPCEGGLTSLTLEYTGLLSVTITAEDGGGVLYVGTVLSGGIFTIYSSVSGQPFVGDYVKLSGTAIDNTTINTSCSTPVEEGSVFGSFTVLGGESLKGGTICCTAEEMEDAPPVISGCPTDISINSSASACSETVSWVAPTATDDCGITSVTSTHEPGAVFPVGITAVVYTFTDGYGNTATCSFNVTVNDATSPIISGCPADVVVAASNSCDAAANWQAPTSTDNCANVTLSANYNPGDIFPVGSTNVTYTAIDDAGNTSICSFNVIVEDVTSPVITNCPSDIHLTLSATSCLVAATWTSPTSADDCGSSTLTSTHQSGDSFSAGTTTVVYTATDDHGNTSSCSFNVVVSDITAPVFDACDESKIVEVTTADGCDATADWSPLTATDNCAVTVSSTHNPGDVFPVGKTQVTYTATDNAGNSVSCSFHVQVKDKTLPVISGCPKDIVTTSVSCEVSVNWTEPTVSDNCSWTLTSSHKPGDYFGIGTTVVTYWATDPSNNLDSCYFNVTVKGEDSEAPVISGCPATDILAATDVNATSCGMAVFWTEPTADDRCGTVSLTSTYTSGDVFPVGTTEVTYTATDGSNNTSTCVFNVVVSDKTGPVISSCPATDIFAIANESCEATVVWTEPTAYDNCGAVTMTSSQTSGATFPMGITEVAYTATDDSGNVSQCMFNVIVRNEAPVVITGCPEDIYVTAETIEPVSIDWEPPSATALCGEVNLTSSHQPGDLFSAGSTVIEYTATDEAGNSTPCTFTVNVAYEEAALDIARILTPDGDGVNDEWILANVENFQDNKVMIVDRWGSVVFSGSGYNNENIVWKGRSVDGVMVPTGTYFYTISIRTASDVVEKRGFIELIR